MSMHRFLSCPTWDFELVRILGATATGGCEVADFLQAVGELRRHDGESWYRAWRHQAESALARAAAAEEKGLVPLARGFLLRASNYFRAAPYMLAGVASSPYPRDPRTAECLGLSADAFDRAAPYMEARVLTLEVPYSQHGGEALLPARLFLPADRQRLYQQQKTPVLVCVGGADSTMQEMYFCFGAPGVNLGYAVLVFHGPGQGDMAVAPDDDGGLDTLRPNYEGVVSAVLDRLWSLARERPDTNLDLNRVAVAGLSLGGYFVLRAAATDPRVAAVVAVDPLMDLWDLALTRLPGWFARGWLAGWISDGMLNALCRVNMRFDVPTRWEFRTSMAIMGQPSPADLLREFRRYTLKEKLVVRRTTSNDDGSCGSGESIKLSEPQGPQSEMSGTPLLHLVKCPVFLTGARLALYLDAGTSTKAVAESLINVPEGQLEVWVPQSVGEGALTAKVGAWYRLAAEVFIFLDRHLKIRRPGNITRLY